MSHVWSREKRDVMERIAERTIKLENGCWVFQGGHVGDGYALTSIGDKRVYVHRLVLAAKLGRELLPKMEACHTCDNPGCINPEHLFEGTRSENAMDASRKGRLPSQVHSHVGFRNQAGENNHQAKLSDKEVAEIRSRYGVEDISQHQLAKEYGVSQSHISYLVNGKVRATT